MTQVVVKAKDAEKNYRQEIKAKSHLLLADVSKDKGGEEAGPDPHELLLGALGACTSMTLQMYAKRKGWNLKSVEIDLTEEEVESKDNASKSVKITRTIHLEGDLTQEQVDQLKIVADKCPIHKILSGPKEINTNISHEHQLRTS